MPSNASALIGITTLGSSSRTMIRRFLAPSVRAARTNSRSANEIVVARATRPTGATDRMPITIEIVSRLRLSSVVIRIARMSAGNDRSVDEDERHEPVGRPRK